jgi:hypothetical protein
MAIDFDIPLFTNIKVAREFIDALAIAKGAIAKGAAAKGAFAKGEGTGAAALEIKAWEEYR